MFVNKWTSRQFVDKSNSKKTIKFWFWNSFNGTAMSFLESSYPQSGSLMLHFPPPPKNPEAGRIPTSVNMRFVAIVSNCRNIRLSLYFAYILYTCCFHKKIIQDYNELHLSAKLRHCSSSRPEVAEYDSVLLSAALCPPAAQNHLARWNKRVGEWYADGWELQIELHVQ